MNNTERIEEKLDFTKIRNSVSARCSTDYAKRRVFDELIISDAKEIEQRLTLTDEMRLICMFEPSFPSNGFIDCLDFIKPLSAPSSVISLENLRRLADFMDNLRKVLNFFGSERANKYPTLKSCAKKISFFPEIVHRIELILDKSGEVRDDASEELLSIRRGIKEKESSISRRIAAVLKNAQSEGLVDEDSSLSIRDGHVLIPINVANKRKIKGIVYDESSSGKTAFVEPLEVIELNNEVRELYFAEQREIVRILALFSDFLRPYLEDLVNGAVFICELDFIRAKALVAIRMEAGKPIISQNSEHKLIKARHPILEATLKKEHKQIVPHSFTLSEKKHIIIISGPNAGGKSVCLKTAGLLQLMFQWGMLVPASEISEFRIFDGIFVDIGDEQSIENDLSTYSSHLNNMKEILKSANSDSLVLIDEFGSGTEPAAGGAIAETVLAELDKRGVFAVITTHYTNLKLYAESGGGAVNAAMLFDTAAIAPLYQLEVGLPGNSFAFELARKIGLPSDIVKSAEERAGTEFVSMEKQLKRISRNRRVIEEKLVRIKHADKTLESVTDKYQKELTEIQFMKKQILQEAKDEAAKIIDEANKKIESTIKQIKESQAERERTKRLRSELSEFKANVVKEKNDEKDKSIEQKMQRLVERKKRQEERKKVKINKDSDAAGELAQPVDKQLPLAVGDKIRLKSNSLSGEIRRINGKKVVISVGDIISTVNVDSVERISNREFSNSIKNSNRYIDVVSESIQKRKLDFKRSIDIRGEHLSDALDIVSRYIDDAIMVGATEVKILHGTGTGVLREEIRKFLMTVAGVISCEDEDIRYGGAGITVVKLEK